MTEIKTSFWKMLWRLLRPYWFSKEKWRALALLAAILFCEAAQVELFVMLNNWQKGFYDALQAFNKTLLADYLLRFSGMVAAFVVVAGYAGFFSGLLANRWRRWLTDFYQKKWVLKKNYYLLELHQQHVDNPDQRISEDLNEFPTIALSLATGIFSSVLTLISFSIILWQLSGSMTLPFVHVTIPGYMFWASLLLASLGTWGAFVIGARLANLSYLQERYNANFRFRLVRIREAAEQIAFYQGERAENSRLTRTFEQVFNNFLEIIKVKKYLSFFNTAYFNFANLAGILIALPKFLAEKLPMGILMQTAHAFNKVNEALSFVVYSYSAIASWRAAIYRLNEFDERMKIVRQNQLQTNITVVQGDEPVIKLHNLTVHLPTGEALLNNINITVNQGQRLLLQGYSGCGKSTLLRVIANMWSFGSGEVILPQQLSQMFFPQRPYLPLGTIRQILIYPASEQLFTDAEMIDVLQLANLPRLANYLDSEADWTRILSLGEQQRLAFCRVLLHKPEYIFLDEATSALDEQNELQLYQALIQQLPNATIISVGHRHTLIDLHDLIIKVDGYIPIPAS